MFTLSVDTGPQQSGQKQESLSEKASLSSSEESLINSQKETNLSPIVSYHSFIAIAILASYNCKKVGI